MECILSLARILDDNEFGDVVVRKHVAQVFLFFLPGLASGFKQIALEDEKVGHKIPQVIIIILSCNIDAKGYFEHNKWRNCVICYMST